MRTLVVVVAIVAFSLGGTAAAQSMKDADSFFSQGRFGEAARAYDMIAEGDAHYQIALRRRGAIALYENRFADAQDMLLSALSLNARDSETEELLAELASRRGMFAQSAAWLALAGRQKEAAVFAQFGSVTPYRIVSRARSAVILLVQTDPLPAVHAKVNGKEGLFLIDTGGTAVILDPAFAAKADVEVADAGTGTFAGGKSAAIGAGRIANFSIGRLAIADVPAVTVPTEGFTGATGGKPVAGVIGTQFLMQFLATIDYPHGRLMLEPKETKPPQDQLTATIPFWLVGDHYMLARGRLNTGHEQMFLIDTGLAGFAFTGPDSTLLDAGIAIPALVSTTRDAVGESASAPFAIASLTLSDFTRRNLQGLYGPFPTAFEDSLGVHVSGLISHAFFRPYKVTFDYRRMKIVITK